MSFSYAAEKFASARSALMLPHPQGEAQSIASAFFECHIGLDRLDRSLLDDDARKWLNELDLLMSTSGLEDPHREGLHLLKARMLSVDDQFQLSSVIDELQCWFRINRD